MGVVSPGFTTGYRAGGGFALSDHTWIVGTLTYFRDSADSSIAAPNGQVLSGNLVFPNTVTAAFLPLAANSLYSINLLMADIDFKCTIVNCDRWQLYWLAGARYAHLDQNLTTNYLVFGTTTVNTGISFDGGGPRAGLEGEYHVGCGFYGFGKGTANLLVGQFSANYLQTQTFAGQQALTHIYDDRVVPILEAELGVGWRSPKGHVSVAAGFYIGSWFNTLTTSSFVQGIQSNNYTTNGNNFRDTMSETLASVGTQAIAANNQQNVIGSPSTPLVLQVTGAVNVTAGPTDSYPEVTGSTTPSINATGSVTLISTGAISHGSGTDITAPGLTISAVDGIGTAANPLVTDVPILDATNTSSGDIDIANTAGSAGLDITGITSTSGGNVDIADTENPAGGAGISVTGPVSVTGTGTDDLTFSSGSPLTISANITSAGSIVETAAPDSPPNDNLTVDSGVTIDSTGSSVSLSAGNNIDVESGSTIEQPPPSASRVGRPARMWLSRGRSRPHRPRSAWRQAPTTITRSRSPPRPPHRSRWMAGARPARTR